jgi:hypothetical protein
MGNVRAVEQRRQQRLKLVCPVRLYRNGEDALDLRTSTDNISSGGFYCVSTIPFAPCERLQCEIELSAPCRAGARHKTILHCHIEVVHSTAKGGNDFGIGCRLVDYELQYH